MDYAIDVDITNQRLILSQADKIVRTYQVSTAKNGPGETFGSECTPRGRHMIRAKIGEHAVPNAVFVGRRATGEQYTPDLQARFPERDWILTRLLWLSGLEPGVNRLGNVDTLRRYIYIHGCPDKDPMGIPSSHGCIKMRNVDVIELFEHVPVGTSVLIE